MAELSDWASWEPWWVNRYTSGGIRVFKDEFGDDAWLIGGLAEVAGGGLSLNYAGGVFLFTSGITDNFVEFTRPWPGKAVEETGVAPDGRLLQFSPIVGAGGTSIFYIKKPT